MQSLICEWLFVMLIAVVPCAVMSHVDYSLNFKLTVKVTFTAQMISVAIGSIVGALLFTWLQPQYPEIYKLGLYVLGPLFGFALGNIALDLVNHRIQNDS